MNVGYIRTFFDGNIGKDLDEPHTREVFNAFHKCCLEIFDQILSFIISGLNNK